MPKKQASNTRLLVAILAAGAAILAFLFLWPGERSAYSVSVAEALTRSDDSRTIRVHGWLIRGSLCKVNSACEYRFQLADDDRADGSVARPILHVRYPGCIIPDLMRYDAPGIEVEAGAEGHVQSKDVMSATNVLAKCPGKYRHPDESWTGQIKPVPPCRE